MDNIDCFIAEQILLISGVSGISNRASDWFSQAMRDLPEQVPVPEDLLEMARVLDNIYIPTRYPNSHPEGAPFEHYGRLQSEEAIKYSRSIIEFVRAKMA